MATGSDTENLARLALFADLTRPQLDQIAHSYDEDLFAEGQRVLRKDMQGTGLYIILDGEAVVNLGDKELARLGRGEFFGDVSALTGQPPTTDIVATQPLRCLVVPREEVEPFLLAYPSVTVRMLKVVLRRFATTLEWLQ
jgi:CRP/FNR family transcriptional regulator, cyclic AMP receptor protein